MRAIRHTLVAVGLAGLLAPTLATAQQVTPAQLLKFGPVQKDLPVEYDVPATADEIAACKAETKSATPDQGFAYILRDAQGRLLRRFAAVDGKKRLNQWSYFKDGFEVYRDRDLDGDGYADECRWLNAGGTRIASLKSNKIVGWKRISAEEASKVLVQALVSQNANLLATVLATPEELASLGVPQDEIDKLAKPQANLAGSLEAMRKGLLGWDAQTVWQRFDGTMPHVIPADVGLKADLILYENAFIFAGPATGQGDPTKTAYLQVPELLKIGETWKFASLPKAVNPTEPVTASADGGLRRRYTGTRRAAAPNRPPPTPSWTRPSRSWPNTTRRGHRDRTRRSRIWPPSITIG